MKKKDEKISDMHVGFWEALKLWNCFSRLNLWGKSVSKDYLARYKTRLDIWLTAGTGYGSLRNRYPEVDDAKDIREDRYEGLKLFRILWKSTKVWKSNLFWRGDRIVWLQPAKNDSWRWISLAMKLVTIVHHVPGYKNCLRFFNICPGT